MVSILGAALAFQIGCGASDTRSTENGTGKEIVENPLWMHYPGHGKYGDQKVVLISGDEEYRSEEVMPQLAKILAVRHGFDCTVLFPQDPAKPGLIDPNYLFNIPGLHHLDDADLMIIFTRFRKLPDEQMQHVDDYLRMGKPVLGIRTATHAFQFEDSTHHWGHYCNWYKGPKEEWSGGFGQVVLGENWYSHHGHHKHQSTLGLLAQGAEDHPMARGIANGDIWGSTDVYGVELPLPGDSRHIILGQVMDRKGEFDASDLHFGLRPSDDQIATKNQDKPYNPNEPMMPIAWTKSYQLPGGGSKGQAFTTTIGAGPDLLSEGVRRLIVNAIYWLLQQEVPAKSKVDLVGDYNPSSYSFHREEGYWKEKNLLVKDQGL